MVSVRCYTFVSSCNLSPRSDYNRFVLLGLYRSSDFTLQYETDEIGQCFRRDIAWSLCGVLDEEELPLLGSWTPFNRLVTSHLSEAIVQDFRPVTPHPPEYPVCKEYLDFLLDLIEELEIPFMYVHSDELVYSKLCDIVWKIKSCIPTSIADGWISSVACNAATTVQTP